MAEILASQPGNPAGVVDGAELQRWVAGSPLRRGHTLTD